MRDFRDAKAMAQSIRAALAAKGLKITIAESLELTARALGAADWNTLSAAIKSADHEPPAEPLAPPPDNAAALDRVATALGWTDWEALAAALLTVSPDQPGRRPPHVRGASLSAPSGNLAMDRLAGPLGWTDWEALSAALRTVSPDQPGRRAPADAGAPPTTAPTRTGTTFSAALEATLHRSVALAAERKHGYNTLEHLLLALIEDPDAAAVMEACAADLVALRATLVRYVDEDLKQLTKMGDLGIGDPAPTAGFHRVIQRSVIHVQSAGRHDVTGANVLVAIFSEMESHAAYFLQQQRMTRHDAVNFIAHGVRKGGAAA
jgi:hypothetical protein